MMFRRLGGALTSLIFIAAILFGTSRYALAAPDFNITTSNSPVLLTAKPGSTVTTNLKVQNSGTQPTRFKVELKKFKAFGDSGKPIILNRQPGDDFLNWVSFSQTSFMAQPQQWNNIKMTISIPKDAGFGYYYAVIFSKDTQNQNTGSKNSNTISGAAAVLVLLDVQAKGEKKQLKVVSFNADKKIYEYLPASFDVKVHNSGNVHIAPAGSIFITKGKSTVDVVDVNPAGGNILPDSSRTFSVAWSNGFPVFETKRDHGQIISDKSGKPEKELKWNFSHANKLRFGHYKAHLLLTYDDGTKDVPLEAEVSFWVLPWKLIFLLLIALVLIGIGAWTVFRRFTKRSKKNK